jgi:cytochrome c oxidase assembly protein subunit 15
MDAMTSPAVVRLRSYAYVVFGIACTHLVFGAIVRISGSGMGCGPHWPDCDGYLFPPLSRPDLIIEVMHRYLASVLLLALIGLVVAAYRRRREPGVGSRGGVLRMASLAMGLGFSAAILGAVTVKLMNSAPATVAHWTVAMSLVATVTATLIRAGGLGGATAVAGGATAKARRTSLVGAGMAIVAVVMGGLTAKVVGGPVACLAFPLCGANPAVPRAAVDVQSTHRVIAVLLVLHLIGMFFAFRKRGEPQILRRASAIALSLGVLQLLVAGAMIGLHLPPVLRSLHEATGVSIWIATFALAYLARLASRGGADDPSVLLVPLASAPSGPALVPAATDRAPAFVVAIESAAVGVRAAGVVVSSGHAAPVGALPLIDSTRSAGEPVVPALALEVPAYGSVVPAESSIARVCDASVELPAALERASGVARLASLRFSSLAACASIAAQRRVVADAVVAEGRVGGPPREADTPPTPDSHNDSGARVIVSSSRATLSADADDTDELYSRRHLIDEGDDERETLTESTPSLDEEFSRLALAAEIAEVVERVSHAVAAVGAGTLHALCAQRRPAMSQSVAVFAARGADV